MRHVAAVVAGRRTKWLVVLAWVVLLVSFAPAGAQTHVTGDLGVNAGFEEVFSSVDTKLLVVTVVLVLVLVLLGAIYRSPLIALIPLAVVGVAYSIAQGLISLSAKSGATVEDNGATILIVLMFGVGTDYCRLLVARYREELRRHEDKHEAMTRAVRRAGPAIVAHGMTVVLAMLVLLVARIGPIHSLGPVAAISVAIAMLAGVTLLPALLAIAGRRPTGRTTASPARSVRRWRASTASRSSGGRSRPARCRPSPPRRAWRQPRSSVAESAGTSPGARRTAPPRPGHLVAAGLAGRPQSAIA